MEVYLLRWRALVLVGCESSIMPLMYNIGNYGRYPVNIYNRVIRFILTFVLPFAFVGVYPAAYF